MQNNMRPMLTFVLAIKDPDEAEFEACLTSMAALKNSYRCDLLIVSSGVVPRISDLVNKRLHSVRVIEQEPLGVYHAYNKGIEHVESDYVLVIGSDDLVLPGLDKVIENIPKDQRPHLIAACCLMQGIGISRPASVRWGLVFRNWCQQGLLYRSDLFATKQFDTKYKMQADHKFNMELVSSPQTQILYMSDVIAHFSSNGISQTSFDWVFREDFPDIVRSCYGSIFWLIALLKRKLANYIKGYRPPSL